MGARRKTTAPEHTWLEGFEPFTAPRHVLPTGPEKSVTIQKTGQISISGDLADQVFDADAEEWRVQFYFNPTSAEIAMISVGVDVVGSYKASRQKGQRVYVNGSRFIGGLRDEGVDIPAERTIYDAAVRDAPKGVVFKL